MPQRPMENFPQSGAESQTLFLITSRSGDSLSQSARGRLPVPLTFVKCGRDQLWMKNLRRQPLRSFPPLPLRIFNIFTSSYKNKTEDKQTETSLILRASHSSKGDGDEVENLQSNNKCWHLPLSDLIPYAACKLLHLSLAENHRCGSWVSARVHHLNGLSWRQQLAGGRALFLWYKVPSWKPPYRECKNESQTSIGGDARQTEKCRTCLPVPKEVQL